MVSYQSTLVHSCNQAVGIWQALCEEGIIVHGKLVPLRIKGSEHTEIHRNFNNFNFNYF